MEVKRGSYICGGRKVKVSHSFMVALGGEQLVVGICF